MERFQFGGQGVEFGLAGLRFFAQQPALFLAGFALGADAAGDVAALTRLPAPILGRVAFQVLAGLTEPGPRSVKELYRAAPYGVGYFAGVWQP